MQRGIFLFPAVFLRLLLALPAPSQKLGSRLQSFAWLLDRRFFQRTLDIRKIQAPVQYKSDPGTLRSNFFVRA